MRAVLICPSPRQPVEMLSQKLPLALTPMLGQSLLEYWLSWLSVSGAREVQVLAHDRPEQIENVAGNGARWGLNVQVQSESRELTPAEARLKYGSPPTELLIEVLDHFPTLPDKPLFTSYTHFYAAVRHWMPFALSPDRVAVREIQSGVWVGSHAHLSADVTLRAPCWVGNHVWIGPRTTLGPGAIIEDGAFLEAGVEVAESIIGADTFVGSLVRVVHSLALGETLVNWQMGSTALIPDRFLLCALRQPRPARTAGRLSRLAEHYGRTKEEALLAWKHLLLHKGG